MKIQSLLLIHAQEFSSVPYHQHYIIIYVRIINPLSG